MDQFLGKQNNSSVHDVTLIDLLSVALLSDRLPVRWALIGIQPGLLELVTEPTPAIDRAIPDSSPVDDLALAKTLLNEIHNMLRN